LPHMELVSYLLLSVDRFSFVRRCLRPLATIAASGILRDTTTHQQHERHSLDRYSGIHTVSWIHGVRLNQCPLKCLLAWHIKACPRHGCLPLSAGLSKQHFDCNSVLTQRFRYKTSFDSLAAQAKHLSAFPAASGSPIMCFYMLYRIIKKSPPAQDEEYRSDGAHPRGASYQSPQGMYPPGQMADRPRPDPSMNT